nr:DUF1631 domain-containing protein [Chiayiivirga flava]
MTIPAPTDKVVDLGPRLGKTGADHSALLGSLRLRATKRLGALLGDVLEKADDTLFDFVQRADGSLNHQEYFDAMRELRKQRPVCEQRYQEHFAEAFAALDRRNPISINLERSLTESRELSLLSEEQLEEQLSTSMVATALSRLLNPLLHQLNHRLGIVAGGQELDDTSNPIAPAHVAFAFRHAMQPCDITIRVKVLLFKLYEREMGRGLHGLYSELNRALVEAGIASEVRPSFTRPPMQRGERRRPDDDGAVHGLQEHDSGPAPAGGGYRGAETATEQSIFASLHDLLEGYRRTQGGPRFGGAAAAGAEPQHGGPAGAQHGSGSALGSTEPLRALSSDEMLSVLSLFQNDMPEGLRDAVIDPEKSVTQRLKQELLSGAERLGLDPSHSRMSAADEDAIDLVGMLFDVMLDERDFNTSTRGMMGRLIVPFTKVAMLDRRMFLQKTHPARRLLNALAEACEGNSGEGPQEKELMGRVDRTITRLVAEFNEDIAIFETLEQEFRDFIEQHRRRVALAERRTAEAQRGRERLEHARAMALEELRALSERHPELPLPLESFLRRYWCHHLTLCALRDDGGSGKYQQAVNTGEELAALAGADADQRVRAERFAAMHAQIEPILVSAGCVGSAAQDVMDSLLTAVGGRAGPAVEQDVVVALERNAPPQEPVAVTDTPVAADEGVSEAADAAAHLDFDPADADRIRRLTIGTWIQFTEDDGTTTPAKLSWISPISNRMLFVNRRGLRYCVASPEELAALMRERKLNIRQTDTAFEHAMSQVLGRLRSGGAETPQA